MALMISGLKFGTRSFFEEFLLASPEGEINIYFLKVKNIDILAFLKVIYYLRANINGESYG
jgi:hypothetical protein